MQILINLRFLSDGIQALMIYYIPTFAANATTPTVRFDAFALFDSLLVFENNTCYVKY